jgi:hypothetical protein
VLCAQFFLKNTDMCPSPIEFHSFVFNAVVLLLLASSGTKSFPEHKGKESTSLMLKFLIRIIKEESLGNGDASTQKVALWMLVHLD